MERTQLFDLMGELKFFGMRSAYDEVMSTGIKRQHEASNAGKIANADDLAPTKTRLSPHASSCSALGERQICFVNSFFTPISTAVDHQ